MGSFRTSQNSSPVSTWGAKLKAQCRDNEFSFRRHRRPSARRGLHQFRYLYRRKIREGVAHGIRKNDPVAMVHGTDVGLVTLAFARFGSNQRFARPREHLGRIVLVGARALGGTFQVGVIKYPGPLSIHPVALYVQITPVDEPQAGAERRDSAPAHGRCLCPAFKLIPSAIIARLQPHHLSSLSVKTTRTAFARHSNW